jgi:hypothetical protein
VDENGKVIRQTLDQTSVEELEEQAGAVDYLTPREFAKLVGIRGEQIYGYIRKGIIEPERCQCGRTVIRVSTAKEALDSFRRKSRIHGQPVAPKHDDDDVDAPKTGSTGPD